MTVHAGRCRSGRRWFWIAYAYDWSSHHKCDDPVCVYDGAHEHGWEDTEDAALAAMRDAKVRLGGESELTDGRGRPDHRAYAGMAADALKRINAARRAARPLSAARDGAVVEYLYGIHHHSSDDWTRPDTWEIVAFRITRKTPKRIYYIRREDGYNGPDIGFIGREGLESDTRCRGHCVASYRCAPGDCWKGDGPGEIRRRGGWWTDDHHLYATRELAEAGLPGGSAETPDLRALRRAMADAHPDRGGTSEGFITARERYERALRRTA